MGKEKEELGGRRVVVGFPLIAKARRGRKRGDAYCGFKSIESELG